MGVVVDANILIAYSLGDEPLHTQAHALLNQWYQQSEQLVAPRLFHSEITAVIRKIVYQQRITVEQGRLLLSQLLQYPIELHEDVALLQDAYELAVQFNRPRAYDSQYMALSKRLSCDFWTADERLVNSISNQFPHIRWLGEM